MRIFAEYKFFRVEEFAHLPGRKTRTYEISSRSAGGILGQIEWYGPWRQFVFSPMGNTVWSDGCLDDLRDCLKKILAAYKKEKTDG